MNNIFKLLTILFVCILIQSCQKDVINNLDPVLPPTPLDSVIRLSKLIFIDTKVSATDTTGYYVYIYDSLQRVTSINIYDYKSVNRTIPAVITYYYYGSNSVAYKKTGINPDPLEGYSDTAFYVYDDLNRLIKDSVRTSAADSLINGTRVVVDQYNYSDTTITAMTTSLNSATPTVINMIADTGFIGSTGDVIKTNEISNSLYYNIDSFTYDNKPNPFYQLNIRTTYHPVPGFLFLLEDFYLQRNNSTIIYESYQTSPGNIVEITTTYTYTYNALDLPDTVNISDNNGPTDEPQIIFLYKKI